MEKLLEIMVMEGIALLSFGFAYAIGVKGRMEFIAGYNARTAARVTDKRGLARLVTRVCVLVGVASALMPPATSLWGGGARGMNLWIGAYGGFLVGVIALTLLQAREFVGPASRSGD